jgi:hypothetical protein
MLIIQPQLNQAAGTLSSFTEVDENCYDYAEGWFTRNEYGTFCNVPPLVWIHVGDIAWILVTLQYDEKTELGP